MLLAPPILGDYLPKRAEANPWGALLGCKCPDCEEDARRWAVLFLDAEFNIVSSTSEPDDGSWCAPIAASAARLVDCVGAEAFGFMLPHLQNALKGRRWSATQYWSLHDMPDTPFTISTAPAFDPQGQISGVHLFLEDATRTQLHQENYLELREKLAIVQQYAADGIISMDVHGQIETINLAVERMFGWGAAELIGRPITMLMPENVARHHQGYVSRFLQTGQSGILNVGPRFVQALRKDGTIFDMELSVAEATIANRTTFIGVCRSVVHVQRDKLFSVVD